MIKQLAAAALSGTVTIAALSRQFNLPRHTVKKIINSPEYTEVLGKMTDDEIMPVINRTRAKITKLGDKAVKVLEKHLEEDNLEGVKLVLKVMGLDNKPEEKQADTNINVILPGSSEKDVPSIVINQED